MTETTGTWLNRLVTLMDAQEVELALLREENAALRAALDALNLTPAMDDERHVDEGAPK